MPVHLLTSKELDMSLILTRNEIGKLEEIVSDELLDSGAELVIIGNKSVKKDQLRQHLRAEQIVLDLVNLDHDNRPDQPAHYQGLCW